MSCAKSLSLAIALCGLVAVSACSDCDNPAGPSAPPEQLDAYVGTNNPNATMFGTTDKAQVFQVQQAGTLVRIEVLMQSATADLVFDIRETAANKPLEDNSQVLYSAVVPAADVVTGYLAVEIDGGLAVTAGQRLAFVMRTTGGQYTWQGMSGDPYRSGAWYVRGGSSTATVWTPSSNKIDTVFRTYVIPEATP